MLIDCNEEEDRCKVLHLSPFSLNILAYFIPLAKKLGIWYEILLFFSIL